MKESRDASKRLSIELSNDDSQFNSFVSRLENTCQARLVKKLNGLDQRYWDFEVMGKMIVLHSDNFMGVSIHVEDGTNDDLLRTIASRILK